MKKKDSQDRSTWTELFSITHISHVTVAERFAHRELPWPDYRAPESYYAEIRERVVPVLIATGLFERTKYKSFAMVINLVSPWRRDCTPQLSAEKSDLWCHRNVHFEDFGYMTLNEFADFQTAITAEGIVAACDQYSLEKAPALELAAKYLLPTPIELSLLTFETSLKLEEPPHVRQNHPLTNDELALSQRPSAQWCAQPPYDDRELSRIGPDTLTVRVSPGMPAEDFVRVANAMLASPLATLEVEMFDPNGFVPPNLSFLKYFQHLDRVSLGKGKITDLSDLRLLSPTLLKLELGLHLSNPKPSLEPLDHFRQLEALELGGHYEDLGKISNLRSLRVLGLGEVKAKNLSSLRALSNLQSLVLSESKIDDLSELPNIGRLQFLCLSRLPNVERLDVIAELRDLEWLDLSGLNKLESLPSLSQLTKLRRVSIAGLKRLTDLQCIADAPNLQQLWIHDMNQLDGKHANCFKGKLSGFRTDNRSLEKSLDVPRLGSGNTFEFTPLNPGKHHRLRGSRKGTDTISPPEYAGSGLDESDQPKEEVRIHIKLSETFGKEKELPDCKDIEQVFEKMLGADLLGRWDASEVGAGYHTSFFVGENAAAMVAALRPEFERVLPRGSFVEVEDAEGNLKSIAF
jgi:hypothetical protein